jgi:hypothetical protein
MKNKPIALIVLSVILVVYVALIVIIDPYNYFNTKIVSQDAKRRIAFPLNERLYRIIEYKHNPLPNILIGDSRIQNLSSAHIKNITNEDYFNFGYGGCTLPELIDSFWFTAKQQKLRNVIIGISFDMYNKYNNTDYFQNSLKSSSFFNYIFNITNFKVIYYMGKDIFSKEKITLGIPKIASMDQYWKEKMDEQTGKFYKTYKYPDEFNKELKKIQDYCKTNNINLVFFIPPTYIELQDQVSKFSLNSECDKFREDIRSIGKVYDFNYDSPFARNKDNFFDPFHSRRDLDSVLIFTMFRDSTYFSRMNQAVKPQ